MALTPVRFLTPSGMQLPAVTADGMREIDRIAIEEAGPNLFQMMENAGRNLALQAIEVLGPTWRERHVVVLAGAGGNGGGGICAARHLANRGADVTLVLAAPLRADSSCSPTSGFLPGPFVARDWPMSVRSAIDSGLLSRSIDRRDNATPVLFDAEQNDLGVWRCMHDSSM